MIHKVLIHNLFKQIFPAKEITFEGIQARPESSNVSYYCVIRKLMIEWDASEAFNEASAKLMFTSLNSDDGIRNNHFISSFIKAPGLRLSEISVGHDKAIRIPIAAETKIEKFTLMPYFDDGELNIKNCSLELELIQIKTDDTEDHDNVEL